MGRTRKELPMAGQPTPRVSRPQFITPDKFHDECAVFGIYGHKEAANITYLGLYALQHRGQEGSGIAASDGEHFNVEKGLGLVADVYTKSVIKRLHGHMAIGHNRYSTAGGSGLKNVQPLTVNFAFGNLALAHNGNLINAQMLRNELEAYGSIFQSTTDSEVIIHLIAHSRADTLLARIVDALSQVRGAFSVVILTDQGVIAARDSYGLRPLCLGQVKGSWVVASETCALDLIGGEYVRDVAPGELVVLDHRGVTSLKPFAQTREAMCVFEYVYFARPDSKIFGNNTVYQARKAYGRQLAKESKVPADLVIAVPDSGVPAALGFSEGAGIPFETGLIRNHYVGRTFIEPEQQIRHFGVKVKLNADDEPEDRQNDPPCRGEGSAHADQLAADHLSLLLRHRHTDQERTDRLRPQTAGNQKIHHGGQPGLSQSRRHAESLPGHASSILQRLLYGAISDSIHEGRRTAARLVRIPPLIGR
jgi:amidophosphoribosyltransferase